MIGYRTRLRAVVSDFHAAAPADGVDFETAAVILAELLAADLAPAQIVPAIDAAITAHTWEVAQLLDTARERVIGDYVHVGQAANDAVNVRIAGAQLEIGEPRRGRTDRFSA